MSAPPTDSRDAPASRDAPTDELAPTPQAGPSMETPPDPRLITEFAEYLRENKKWWLIPLLGSLLVLAALTVLSASPAAPFIYTLF